MFQLSRLLYFTTIILGFFSVANIVLASPTTKALGELNPLPYEQKGRRHTLHNRLKEIAPDILPITPRADPYGVLPMTNLQPGWALDFYEYDWGYLPVTSASLILQKFYQKIFELAASLPGPVPDRAILSFGQLELEVISNSGAVAWESVATFAAHMLGTAQRGYTNSYHCHLTNVAAGAYISFNLYVNAIRRLPPPKFND